VLWQIRHIWVQEYALPPRARPWQDIRDKSKKIAEFNANAMTLNGIHDEKKSFWMRRNLFVFQHGSENALET